MGSSHANTMPVLMPEPMSGTATLLYLDSIITSTIFASQFGSYEVVS